MTCQHVLFGSVGNQIQTYRESRPQAWFQPIVDTFEHRILAHECLLRGDESDETAQDLAATVRSAASQSQGSLYFVRLVPAWIDDPELDLRSIRKAIFDSGMNPRNVVFEVAEPDIARDPDHSHRIREFLRNNGFGFALSGAGVGPGAYSFEAVTDFSPDYIKVDKRLVQNIELPACAPAVGKLVQMAEHKGARVIAEGVDRIRTVENLWLLGVRFMQGHLFGDPSLHIA